MITPFLSFSETALAKNVQRWHQVVVASDRRWAAALTSAVPMNLIQDVVLPKTGLAACSNICDAEYLSEAGFEEIILTGRAVHPEALRRLQCLAERRRIVAVIDHFRHAELLSQCVQQSGSDLEILIEVDPGRQIAGVHPGSDASLLATAASRLAGLRVIGVFASASDCCAEHESVDSDGNLTAIVTICEHALRSIRDVDASCREIVVSISSASRPSLQGTQIHRLIASPFANLSDDAVNHRRQPEVSLMATVISRPALERCVIDAGRIAFGGNAGTEVYAPIGASILCSTPETSVLNLSGDASDLRIGDTVQLVQRNPERLLNQLRLLPTRLR